MPRKKKPKPYVLTKEDLLALSCFTETLLVPDYDDILAYVGEQMGVDVYSHELAFDETWARLKQYIRPKIIDIVEAVYGEGSMDAVKQMAVSDSATCGSEEVDAPLQT